jgi:hypothetical protein
MPQTVGLCQLAPFQTTTDHITSECSPAFRRSESTLRIKPSRVRQHSGQIFYFNLYVCQNVIFDVCMKLKKICKDFPQFDVKVCEINFDLIWYN